MHCQEQRHFFKPMCQPACCVCTSRNYISTHHNVIAGSEGWYSDFPVHQNSCRCKSQVTSAALQGWYHKASIYGWNTPICSINYMASHLDEVSSEKSGEGPSCCVLQLWLAWQASPKSSAKTFATLRPLTQEELEPYKSAPTAVMI